MSLFRTHPDLIEMSAGGPEPDRLPFAFVEGEAFPEAADMNRLLALEWATLASVVGSCRAH